MNQNELYHHGVKGMKWGKRKNYYGQSGDKFRASNGVTVGAPKNAGVAAFRKVQGSKVGGGTLNGFSKMNTAFYGRGKNKKTWKNIENKVRKENQAVREANKAHKKALNDAYGNIKKGESITSKMTYSTGTYRQAAKNMVNKGMSQEKAVSRAKMAAWRNAGIAAVGSYVYANRHQLASSIKKYVNTKAKQRANAGLAKIGTLKLTKVAGNVYEYRMR